jgi:rod shape-determining protein MreB
MLGRTPGNITAIRPLREGVIADFDITEAMLRHFIHRVYKRRSMIRPRIIVSIPSGITQVERRAVRETVAAAGAREIFFIEEPMAAAIGAGLPVMEPTSSMVVDIGGGTTEVAVISLSGIVYSKSVRSAGDRMDEEIVQYIKKNHNLLIGERSAEIIKMTIGSAYPDGELQALDVKGRNLISGIPSIIEINSEEVRESIMEPVDIIIATIKNVLENAPPELAGDIVEGGIVLTGGGALLKNLDLRIKAETGLPVAVADDPLSVVARGAGMALDHIDVLKAVSS